MNYEAIEQQATRDKLNDVERAVVNFPSKEDYILDGFTLSDLIKMAEVANYEVTLRFLPRKDTVPNSVPEEWLID